MQSPATQTKNANFQRQFALLLGVLALIWALALFTRTAPFTPDEPREFDIAWNMLHQANKSVPLLAGEPFCEKPPLTYWAAAASMQIFGPSLWAARLPNLVWAAVTLACLLAWIRSAVPDTARERSMLVVALTSSSMLLLFRVQIWLATDAPLVAATAVALLGAWRGLQARTTRQRVGWYLLFHLGLSAAFFAKNLLGWIVPIGALGSYVLWERRWRELTRWELYVGLLLQIALLVPWIWAVANHEDGARLLRIFLIDNTLGRFLPIATEEQYELGHRNHPGKYLIESLYYLLPWTIAFVGAIRWSIKSLRMRDYFASAIRFAVVSIVPSLLFLSLAKTARDVYLTPPLLGVPILLGLWLGNEVSAPPRFDRICLRITAIVAILVAALLIAISFGIPALQGQFDIAAPTMIIAVIAIVSIALLTLHWRARWRDLSNVFVAWGAFAIGIVIVSTVLLPSMDAAQDLRPTVQAVATQFRGKSIGVFRGDETIRAYLDFGAGIAAVTMRSLDEAVQWINAEPNRVLLLELRTDHVTEKARAQLGSWREQWRNIAPPDVSQAAIELQQRGLKLLWQWEISGGRTYGVLGTSH